MTGTLLHDPVIRAVDANGDPLAGAQLQFYATGTTTPQAVYTDDTLGTPLANPVVADSGGLFVPIFLNPAETYRAQLLNSAGTLIADMDPINGSQTPANGSITAAMLAAGAAAGNLGFTPLNKAGDTATNLLIANSTIAATSAGYLGAPVNEQDASYVLVLSDAGKMIRTTNGSASTITIPPSSSVAWPVGAAIVLRNAGAGTVTVTRGSSVILIGAGTNTNKDWSLGAYGMATIIRDASNDSWVISGVGVS
jgi:hypothetical protein